MSDINVLGQEFDLQVFDSQRRSIPKAYALGNEIRSLSKEGINCVVNLDWKGVDHCMAQISNVWQKLGELNLPKTFQGYQDFEAAQEMIELFAVSGMFEAIIYGDALSAVHWDSFSPEKLNVTPQAWLFCLLDAGSELSRCVSRYIIKSELSRETRLTVRQRFLALANELNDFLEKFMDVTPAVMDAYNKYGFRQGFRSKMNQLRGAIEYQTRLVEESIERED